MPTAQMPRKSFMARRIYCRISLTLHQMTHFGYIEHYAHKWWNKHFGVIATHVQFDMLFGTTNIRQQHLLKRTCSNVRAFIWKTYGKMLQQFSSMTVAARVNSDEQSYWVTVIYWELFNFSDAPHTQASTSCPSSSIEWVISNLAQG